MQKMVLWPRGKRPHGNRQERGHRTSQRLGASSGTSVAESAGLPVNGLPVNTSRIGVSTSHRCSAAGTYRVTLTVTDDGGAKPTDSGYDCRRYEGDTGESYTLTDPAAAVGESG